MATAHSLVAGAIAAKIGNPMLALPLSLASHFILDSIPHWDFGTNWRKRTKAVTGIFAVADTVVGFTIAFFLFHTRVSSFILIPSLILSVLPDWLEAPWYIFFADQNRIGPKPHAPVLEKISYSFYKLTNRAHSKASYPWGLITQVLTVIFFLLILK